MHQSKKPETPGISLRSRNVKDRVGMWYGFGKTWPLCSRVSASTKKITSEVREWNVLMNRINCESLHPKIKRRRCRTERGSNARESHVCSRVKSKPWSSILVILWNLCGINKTDKGVLVRPPKLRLRILRRMMLDDAWWFFLIVRSKHGMSSLSKPTWVARCSLARFSHARQTREQFRSVSRPSGYTTYNIPWVRWTWIQSITYSQISIGSWRGVPFKRWKGSLRNSR